MTQAPNQVMNVKIKGLKRERTHNFYSDSANAPPTSTLSFFINRILLLQSIFYKSVSYNRSIRCAKFNSKLYFLTHNDSE